MIEPGAGEAGPLGFRRSGIHDARLLEAVPILARDFEPKLGDAIVNRAGSSLELEARVVEGDGNPGPAVPRCEPLTGAGEGEIGGQIGGGAEHREIGPVQGLDHVGTKAGEDRPSDPARSGRLARLRLSQKPEKDRKERTTPNRNQMVLLTNPAKLPK